ncbi:MAG: glycosyltransferase [Gammaproteobacteria bacterium]|nr:glycosyltransferase [Gammaproteobacteria bacterium]MDH4254097.1 glycosyltransferase [Gammaproteobacteria bacterium]MDH5309631.1 glycosyltransferase [Gammaproteobacteria bacterium]
MRHLALVSTSYPDGAPGSEAAGSFVEDFAVELSGRVRVSVLAAATAESMCRNGNLSIRRFAVPRLPLSLLRATRPADWPAIIDTLRSGSAALDRLCREDRPDHILALWALPSGYWARSSGLRHGIRYSIWALGSDIWSLGRLPLVRGALRRVLADAANRYADGLQLASDVERISGMACSFLPSTRRLPQPTRTTRRSTPPYRLAFLGRWHSNKGVDVLLDALGRLDDGDWKRIAEIRVCGGGALEDAVRQSIGALQAQGRPVSIGGYLDKQAAADLIGGADYLLLPSRIESIPVIFSDAVQAGTPLVATPVGDLPRLFRKYRVGVISESVEAQGYTSALRAALGTDPRTFESGLVDAMADFDLGAAASRVARECVGDSE